MLRRWLRLLLHRLEQREAERLARQILNCDPEILHLVHERLSGHFASHMCDALTRADAEETSGLILEMLASAPDGTLPIVVEKLRQAQVDAFELDALTRLEAGR